MVAKPISYNKYVYLLNSLTAIAFFTASTPVLAETAKDVVVSASRIPVPANSVGSSISVITAKDIERLQATSVADVLRTVPGVAVSQTGSQGGLSQVRIRGAQANHTLVIIDGIEMNDPARSSEFDFANLLVSEIERIEVLRGPQSALYGSDAIGGVIVIQTKSGGSKSVTSSSLSYGSYKTSRATVATRGGGKTFNYALSAIRYVTEGFSAANEKRGATEKDGYTNNTFNLNMKMLPTENTQLTATLRKTNAEADVDGFSGGQAVDANSQNEIDKLSGKVGGQIDLLDGLWTHKVSYGMSRNDIDSFTNSLNTFSTRGKKQKLDYQNYFTFGGGKKSNSQHVLVTAFEREKDEMFSTFSGGKRVITNLGYITEYRYSYRKRLFSSLAFRFDDNDIFDDANTGRATLAYLLGSSKKYRLHSSYGTGVKNPTLFELFGSLPNFTGNPNLTPETAKGWDAGIESHWFNRKLKVDITYFRKNITDLITGAGNTAINLNGDSKSQGAELTARWNVSDKVSLTGSYTYTEAKTAAGVQQVRRPRHHVSLDINYAPIKSTNINLAIIGKSDIKDFQFDAAFNRTLVPLDNYTLVNLGVSHKLSKIFTVSAKVKNLFNEEYEEVLTYGTSERAYYLSVNASF